MQIAEDGVNVRRLRQQADLGTRRAGDGAGHIWASPTVN